MKNLKKYFLSSLLIFAVMVPMTFGIMPKKAEAGDQIKIVGAPIAATLVGSKLYVVDNSYGNIEVVDTNTHQILTSINIYGSDPRSATLVGTKLYVTNFDRSAVSVIDTATDTQVALPNTQRGPMSATVVGTKLYVNNYDDASITAINTNTDSTITHISLPSRPAASATLVGSKLYVPLPDSDKVSVINTNTNTIITNPAVGSRPSFATAIGTKVYVLNPGNKTVSIIDTNTDTVSANINVQTNPVWATVVGTTLYVSNQDDKTISVIDYYSNSVIATISLSGTLGKSILVGSYLYVVDLDNKRLSVIDINTNTVTTNVAVGSDASSLTLVGGRYLYVTNKGDKNITVVDTNNNTVVDVGAPYRNTNSITSDTITLSYDENLDTGSIPATSDFVVNVNSNPVAISSLEISGKDVLIKLADPVFSDDIVQIVYTVGSNPVQDLVGNAIISFTANLTNITPNSAPDKIGTISATAVSATKINLAWTAPSTGGSAITGYKIERKVGSGSFATLVADTGNTDVTYSDTGLTAGTLYTYRISAINALGTGSASDNVSATPVAAAAGSISLVTISTDGTQANDYAYDSSISSDGRYVTYYSGATNLVAGDTNGQDDVFVRDTQTNTTTREGLATDGTQGDGWSDYPIISSDGKYIVFSSSASNLVAGDTNGQTDVFLTNTQTNTTTRVSVATDGTEGNSFSNDAFVSTNGRYVVFDSIATNLVAGDTNGQSDIFVRDTQSNTTTRVSVATGGTEADNVSYYPSVSSDGRYVTYYSGATNLVVGDTNGQQDIFVRDTQTNTTTRVSVATDGTEGNGASTYPFISPNGRYIVFSSDASNLVAGDTNGVKDVFLRDTQTNTTTRVSVATDGTEGNGTAGYYASITPDGRYVVFYSDATNLVTGDTNGKQDVFVRDTQTNTTSRVSVAADGTEGDGHSYYCYVTRGISDDGHYIIFDSDASNLVDDDTNGNTDTFLVANPLYVAPVVPPTPSIPTHHGSTGGSISSKVVTPVVTTPVVTTPTTSSFTFTKLLKYSMINNDVKELQKFLNTHGYQIAATGAGSPGHETNYFGTLTKKAVIKFQLANKLVGDGIIGPKTNAVINSLNK